MLIINATEEQSILIDRSYSIKIEKINVVDSKVSLRVTNLDGKATPKVRREELKIGHSVQIAPNVLLTIPRIVLGSEGVAVMGFDAPRHIRIKGDWLK